MAAEQRYEIGQTVEAKVRNGTVIARIVGYEDGGRKATPYPDFVRHRCHPLDLPTMETVQRKCTRTLRERAAAKGIDH